MNQPLPLRNFTTELFGEPLGADKRRGAFTDNMKLPVHRWFRYSAGFSAEWVESLIDPQTARSTTVLDPFAGSGTTLIASQALGARAHGFEAQHFVARVAQAKLGWPTDPHGFHADCQALLAAAKLRPEQARDTPAPLLLKCFEPQPLGELLQLRAAFEAAEFRSRAVRALVWLAITAILRECSHVGTAQWQYVLPKKAKARVRNPFDAFAAKSNEMLSDMLALARPGLGSAVLHAQDARQRCPALGEASVDMVITSPPYPNNYDYADATRLEMTFWGEVDSWGDLHGKVRRHLITSCSQHASADKLALAPLLSDPILQPIRSDITEVCSALAEAREQKAGKKAYHTMVAAYFCDLGQVWQALRYHVKPGGVCHFVIGDSAPYGIYVPADEWLGKLALEAGFKGCSFEKFRDRNTKWKNRKHRVPLKEGVLTVLG